MRTQTIFTSLLVVFAVLTFAGCTADVTTDTDGFIDSTETSSAFDSLNDSSTMDDGTDTGSLLETDVQGSVDAGATGSY